MRAIVFTIILSGYHPRCALDASDGAEVRVGKIVTLIGECDWGIHDLSRIELADGVPRFNMPMELGLHLGARLLAKGRHSRKRAQDIAVHRNEPDEAIRCVRNWLSEHRPSNSPPLPGADAMQDDYRAFQAGLPDLDTLKSLRLHPDKLTHDDFLHVVRDWITARVGMIIRGELFVDDQEKFFSATIHKS